MRRPLGLFLQGGGALGAWQAGALEALDAAGVRFDAVMGYSIGVVNGAALAFGRLDRALEMWRGLDGGVLTPRPRLRPFALCSPAALSAFFRDERDDAAAKAALRVDLTVASAVPATSETVNARFTPGGRGEWDGPFIAHAAASCAIPVVFPPVDLDFRGRRLRLFDGGVPMRSPLDFTPLAGCADLLVLEMVRADEMGRRELLPWRSLDQGGREAGRRIVDRALEALRLSAESQPRVIRLAPSRRLEPMMLDFRARGLRKMLALGAEDARAVLDVYWKK
ncbi:MAG: patatin-like phospholipase family protein [Elusimicrobiota bacterium]